MLGTDSGEYEILADAAKKSASVKGLSIEIGLREGGGTHYMISQYVGVQKTHIALDPYGDLPYIWKEGQLATWTYDNGMRNKALVELFANTANTNINFLFFNLTDADYFNKFSDGMPIYAGGFRELETQYSCVHLDAEHTVEALTRQVEFFRHKVAKGGFIVVDDVEFFDIAAIEKILFDAGFTLEKKGSIKASYKKG